MVEVGVFGDHFDVFFQVFDHRCDLVLGFLGVVFYYFLYVCFKFFP